MDEIKLISDYLPEIKHDLETQGDKPELCINSIPSLNNALWGLKRQKLYVIGGRTSQGKSALVLQIGYDIAKQGKCVLYLSLEMTTKNVIKRLFCNEMEIDNEDIERGKFEKHKDKWAEFNNRTQSLRLSVTDTVGSTWRDIDKLLDNLTTKPDMIIVDYIQNIKRTNMDFKLEMDEYIRKFQEIAIKRNLVAVLVSQINRDNQNTKDKRPYLHNLKGTGNLEQAPDVILLLHYPCVYSDECDPNEYHVQIEKNRDGRVGFVKIHFEGKYYKFKDWDEKPKYSTLEDKIKKGNY